MVRCVVCTLLMTLICQSEAQKGSSNHKSESMDGLMGCVTLTSSNIKVHTVT